MLSNRLGRQRVVQESAGTDALIRLCAGLPLALSITAARAALNPVLPLEDIAGEFGTMQRLDLLSSTEAGRVGPDLRGVFAWSYSALTGDGARLFRLLGAHPGAQISLSAACSLSGLDRLTTRILLRELTGASLLTEPAAGVYVLHDLVREYAEELLKVDDERDEATARLLDHYVHSTRNAWLCFGLPAIAPLDSLRPEVAPDEFATYVDAAGWYKQEVLALNAVTLAAAARREDLAVVSISLDRRPMEFSTIWSSAEFESALLAQRSAARLGDVTLIAEVERALFTHARLTQQFTAACDHATRARDLFQSVGNVAGQVDAMRLLSAAERLMGEPTKGRATIEAAVELAEHSGVRHVIAMANRQLADDRAMDQEFEAVVAPATRALQVAQELGIDIVAFFARRELLRAYLELQRFTEAVSIAEQLHTDGAAVDEHTISALPDIATAYLGAGDRERARAACATYLEFARAYGEEKMRSLAKSSEFTEERDRLAKVLLALQQDGERSE